VVERGHGFRKTRKARTNGMKLDCYLVPSEVTESTLKGRVVVIIDVLRSCTTIAYALLNGAEKIIPAGTVEAATKLMSSLDRASTLLCGERDGKKVSGFDLGNSPLEYTREAVAQKTLVFASTNGTKLMSREIKAEEQLICSFVNAGKVIERLGLRSAEPVILCSGTSGKFSMEDSVCAGMVAQGLMKVSPQAWDLNDAAKAAVALYEKWGNDIFKMVSESSHGKYLLELGFSLDLEVCSRVDSVPVLSVLKEGRITVSQ
jgi:2-phosphosulfolactate phosphatase